MIATDFNAGMVIPKTDPGDISAVSIVESQGQFRFKLGQGGRLRVYGDSSNTPWYACPVRKAPRYVLYYGHPKNNELCEHIGLTAKKEVSA
jgi:hypothetical protein